MRGPSRQSRRLLLLAVVAGVAPLAAPRPALAQRAQAVLDVGAARRPTTGIDRGPLYGDAAGMLAWDRASVAARVTAAPTARIPDGRYGTLSVAFAQPLGRWVAALGLSAATGERTAWIDDARRDLEIAPTLARGPWVLSARLGSSRVYDWGERDARSHELLLRRDFTRGWVALAAATARFADTATVRHDTTYLVAGFPFRGHVERLGTAWRDWARTGLEVGGEIRDVRWVARGGLPAGRDARASYAPWASLTTTWPVGPRTAVVLAAGRQPGLPEHRLPASAFAMVGVRLTNLTRVVMPPGTDARVADDRANGARLQLLSGRDGRRLLLLTGMRAERVDLNGDATSWEPIAMERVGPDTWQCMLPMAPGAWRLVVSIDGGPWRPPPGLPITSDGFGEDVGVLLVPEG